MKPNFVSKIFIEEFHKIFLKNSEILIFANF